jgi:hypothetical protein
VIKIAESHNDDWGLMRIAISLLLSFCVAVSMHSVGSANTRAQKASSESNFVLDENRPFVYIEFDHIGPGARRGEAEPLTRIWLRLKNNCKIPINVRANGVPDGSPAGEVGVMHDVVLDAPTLTITGYKSPNEEESVPPPDKKQTKKMAEQMPTGYMNEVGSRVTIMPGKEILFSIPINHVSESWHIEIPFEFDLLNGKFPRDPKVSLGPDITISYSLWNLPPEERAKIENK